MESSARFVLSDPLPGVERVIIFGLGWTGVAAASLLHRFGKVVSATDTRDAEALARSLQSLETSSGVRLPPGVTIHHGPHHHHDAQAVVLTQSLRHSDPAVQAALSAGLPVVPESALATAALEGTGIELVAIAGTDGKTTTTKLVGHIVGAQRRCVVGGNSWTPLSTVVMDFADALLADPPADVAKPVVVAEISAFQLPAWHTFHPNAAVVTNVAEDHVDEFFDGSMESYVAAKRAVTSNLRPGEHAVLNADDRRVASWEEGLVERGVVVIRASLTSRAVYGHPNAAFRSNGELRVRWRGEERGLMPQRAVPLVGDHNIENVLCAVGLVLPLGLDLDAVAAAIGSFVAPKHRLQFVRSVGGFEVYDDSKATNAHASLAGLAAFGGRPMVLVVGGVDKGLDIGDWVETLRARARTVVAIGQLRRRLTEDYGERLPQLVCAETFEEAVERALGEAKAGDVVVLSPACSSFDMFSSYAERGERFQELVNRWEPK